MNDDGQSPYSDEYIAWCHSRRLNPASHIVQGIYSRTT